MSRPLLEFHSRILMGIGTIRNKGRLDTHRRGKAVRYNRDICSRWFDSAGTLGLKFLSCSA